MKQWQKGSKGKAPSDDINHHEQRYGRKYDVILNNYY